uniref:Uncharacterized protein n=1 Tax=viral metagenome TaxID=1070528 RepID=A0A6M3J0W7_9ZZZZ
MTCEAHANDIIKLNYIESQEEVVIEDLKKQKENIIEQSKAEDIIIAGDFYYDKKRGELDTCQNIAPGWTRTYIEKHYVRRRDAYFSGDYREDMDIRYWVDEEHYKKLPRKIKNLFKKWSVEYETTR